jgi:hypothetical protein
VFLLLSPISSGKLKYPIDESLSASLILLISLLLLLMMTLSSSLSDLSLKLFQISEIIPNTIIIRFTNKTNNTAVGYLAGLTTLGDFNTALGALSLYGFGGAHSYNVSLGAYSGFGISSGNYNTFVGSYAGYAITTGANNIFIGSGSGLSVVSGNNNTIIGKYAGTSALTSTVVLADGLSNIYLYATASQVAINKTATPNAPLDVNGNTIITGSLTITGNIVNNLGMGFVSCSLAVSGAAATQRAITAEFLDVDGTSIPRAQLIHWWTSTVQTGSASAIGAGTATYTVVSGSNIVPIANSGSINHAMTDNSGKFAIRLTTAAGPGTSTVWFNTEVQGIVYSISTTLNNNI